MKKSICFLLLFMAAIFQYAKSDICADNLDWPLDGDIDYNRMPELNFYDDDSWCHAYPVLLADGNTGTLFETSDGTSFYLPDEQRKILNTNTEQNYFKIWPNPATGLVNVLLPLDNETETNISIISSTGETIYSDTRIQGESSEINTSNFVAGSYIIQLTNGNKHYSEKLIICK